MMHKAEHPNNSGTSHVTMAYTVFDCNRNP